MRASNASLSSLRASSAIRTLASSILPPRRVRFTPNCFNLPGYGTLLRQQRILFMLPKSLQFPIEFLLRDQ
jgi:hypothetical protein